MTTEKRKVPTSVRTALAKRAALPLSWKKAAGILRGKRPNPIKELASMRAEWKTRMKGFEKRFRT